MVSGMRWYFDCNPKCTIDVTSDPDVYENVTIGKLIMTLTLITAIISFISQ